jgi:translation initiation factor 3 subunit A
MEAFHVVSLCKDLKVQNEMRVVRVDPAPPKKISSMAPTFYQKPETALKLAEEFVAVSKHASAVSLLHEVILSKRARTTSIQTLEPILLRFIELSVQLGKGKLVREALVQYKNIAQTSSISSIEIGIKRFLELAKDKVEQAQKKAKQINLGQIDDLEAGESPESLMLKTLSSDYTKERTDRQVVTPWLRFLWEAFRTSLDTLRNNAKMEGLYQSVANQAFQFCLKYDRKVEFRRLCETLRQHMLSAAKYAHQQFSINLNDPETLQRHLETRFSQLNAAAELELWQEGFRTVEDIYYLLKQYPRKAKQSMMANYYEKLSKILMVGENYLFHSAAFCEYYNVMLQKANLPEPEMQKLASTFLVSALAIPIIRTNSNFDEEKNKNARLTELLRQSQVPTRESLLQQALSKKNFSLVRPEVKELYQLLEVQFHPLSICQKVAPIMKSFGNQPELERYVKPLHSIILTRLLQQLSQVYSSIKIESVVKLAAFPAPYNYDAYAIEKFVMNGCRRGEFAVHINHATQSLIFESGSLTVTAQSKMAPSIGAVRLQLNQFSERLARAMEIIDPSIRDEKKQKLVLALQTAAANIEEDRRAFYRRRELIEAKAARKEVEAALKEKLRQQRMVELQQAEEARLAEQEKKLASERLELQRKEIERAEALKLAEKIAAELREKNVKIKDSEMLDTEKLIELQAQQIEKEKKELILKAKTITKRLDHTERALRKEEIPLLEEDYKKQQQLDIEAYELKKKTMLEGSKSKYERNMLMKKRVSRMLDDYQFYRNQLVEERNAYFEQVIAEANEKMEAEKEARRQEIAKKLEETRRKEQEEREKAESKLLLTIGAAEEARKRKEQEAKKAQEEEERRKKLDEIARIQREKEAAIEAKLAAKSTPAPAASTTESKWKPGQGSWRNKSGGVAPPPPQAGSRPPNATPTAFSSTFNKNRPDRDQQSQASSSSFGRPKIGSGKWSSRNEEQK